MAGGMVRFNQSLRKATGQGDALSEDEQLQLDLQSEDPAVRENAKMEIASRKLEASRQQKLEAASKAGADSVPSASNLWLWGESSKKKAVPSVEAPKEILEDPEQLIRYYQSMNAARQKK